MLETKYENNLHVLLSPKRVTLAPTEVNENYREPGKASYKNPLSICTLLPSK